MKKILITGSSGFVGSNLRLTLESLEYVVLTFEKENTLEELESLLLESDFVAHLAGVNRPKNKKEFYEGNQDLTQYIVDTLEKHNHLIPVVMSSSIHAENDNDYGQSKKFGENALRDYKGTFYIYRYSNMYGKWSRPNYNSVIATWCHNINHGIELEVSDPSITIPFIYIDDVVQSIVDSIQGRVEKNQDFLEAKPIDNVSLGEVKKLLESFKETRHNLHFPNLKTRFSKNLYSTFLSYIPINEMSYELMMHKDERGSFTEFMKDFELGQISVNISKPGITKGQHWHHSKNEKFLVVSGCGVIQMRHIITDAYYEYKVTGDKLMVVDIPTGYTHNIINTGDTDMVTIMWVNEIFDSNNPDTYFLEV